jgi:chemotaxis family two-component system sensor histidine kinase/response regulator PixL
MDKEQQIRINFLDEAEEYFEQVESVILGLAVNTSEPQDLDRAMRAAHSVKGGAAMMGFIPLSQVAHRLEDFLKILRLRPQSKTVSGEVETLLLRGVDCLRNVSSLHRQGTVIDDPWMKNAFAEIFAPLQGLLGDLQDEDENALMQQDEDVDPAVMIFEEGVEKILDRLEEQLSTTNPEQLRQELALTAEELVAFGFMANLQPFIQLCQSVQAQAAIVPTAQISTLTERSLALWRRSHALVMRGSLAKLPTAIEGFSSANQVANPELGSRANHEINNPSPTNAANALNLDPAPLELEPTNHDDYELSEAELEFSPADLDIAATFNDLWEAAEDRNPQFSELDSELDLGNFLDFSLEEAPNPTKSQNDQAELEVESEAKPKIEPESGGLSNLDRLDLDQIDLDDFEALQAAFAPEPDSEAKSAIEPEIAPIAPSPLAEESDTTSITIAASNQAQKSEAQTVRVPVEQLQQFNNLFGKLVLERNTVNLRLDQLKNFVSLMRQRIYQLDQSNTQLRKWYDRASLEGIVPGSDQPTADANGNSNQAKKSATDQTKEALQDRFDALEMDRYSDLHLISQQQIETIVQLKEVSSDVDLELQEMTLAVQNLNQTMQSLQGNVTRTQMLSFAEAVKRYPRAVRDLSAQFDKPVNLVIEGESTLMDRAVLEALASPLMHLLRNAFDHGIEDRQTRIAAGKSPQGTIKLSAVNRGLQTVITVQDDGGGIRLDKIRDRVRAMGLTDQEVQRMSEADILNCIFEPGFSTAAEVTQLSGRGMGMDIVRTALKDIRGDIQVQSKPGVGTTFTLQVPFTLSILRVMLLEQSGIVFAVPADTVQEVYRLESDWQRAEQGLASLHRDDQEIPLVFLEQHLAFQRSGRPFVMPGTPIINQPMAIIVGENTAATSSLYVSRHWGEQEVTLRPINSPLPLPPGFISSIVLGDGRVVPLVDPLQLVEWCIENNDAAHLQAERSPKPMALVAEQAATILIVDDSINVRRYLALTLEKAGYQVEQAKDGQEAVDKLNDGLAVQAVVCDIEMPRLDGYGVLEAIKDKAEFQNLPIAMLTSRSNEKHRKLALNLGAAAYFSKPYEEEQLLQTLSELIQQTDRSSTLELVK